MKLKIFSVFDSKVGAYMSPFFMRSAGEAIRALIATARDPKSQFGAFPSDYTLFEVGVFDDQWAKFEMPVTPYSHGLVSELLAMDSPINRLEDAK